MANPETPHDPTGDRRRAAALTVASLWDGCSAAELVLDLLVALGEEVREELHAADYKWTRNLYPVKEPS